MLPQVLTIIPLPRNENSQQLRIAATVNSCGLTALVAEGEAYLFMLNLGVDAGTIDTELSGSLQVSI
jgi:hypothetical protein